MRRSLIVVFMAAVLMTGSSLVLVGSPAGTTSPADETRIAALLDDMTRVDLASLPALPVARYVLPPAGVDVMRVRLEETYDVAGIGRDTVQLTGWIAARHDNARPAEGESDVRWGTAIVDTEFVGLELQGHSDLFGPVHVSLDRDMPSNGQVGKLSIPFFVQMGLEQAYRPLRTGNAASAATGAGAIAQQPPSSEKPVTRFKGPQAQIYKVMQGLWDSISRKDTKAMAGLYSRAGQNMFFGTPGTGLKFKGVEPYMDAVNKQFENVKSLKVTPNTDDMDIKVFGRFAVVAVTGTNDVIDNEGKEGKAEWRSTVRLQQEAAGWKITHDHTSFNAGVGDIANKAGKCLARLRVNVSMPELALQMRTENPVTWYSEVETIPPVGYTASVSATPTRMISAGRAVATLESGAVRFREIVRQVPLEGTKFLAMNR